MTRNMGEIWDKLGKEEVSYDKSHFQFEAFVIWNPS